jgi:hypothetical protein
MSDAAIGWGLPFLRNRNRRHILGAVLYIWGSARARERVVVSPHPARRQRYPGRREAFIETAAMWREMDRL